jgi:hypothetical protein
VNAYQWAAAALLYVGMGLILMNPFGYRLRELSADLCQWEVDRRAAWFTWTFPWAWPLWFLWSFAYPHAGGR